MSFNFGGAHSTPKTAATGFTLPTNPTQTFSTTGFQLSSGAGDNKVQSKPSLFGASSSSPAFPVGASQPKIATTLSFGTPTSAATPTSSFGTPTSAATQTSSFGTPTSAATQTSLGASITAPVTTATPTTIPQFSFGASKVPSTISFTPILGSTTASTAATTGVKTGAAVPSTPTGADRRNTVGFAPPPRSIATPVSTLGGTSTALAATTVTSTTTTIPATGSLSFAQLEDSINKWTIDLEEQGKFFVNQAKQLNAWDSLLISNGEKILNLNKSIERVKLQQLQLDQELDFVLAQQKELEELLLPLEKELVELPVSDIDRNQMYHFSEIIDSQLKQMSDDLKEIIEHINESNKDEGVSNPVTQISRILNAHMNSLQWIDTNTAQISSQLEQITKMQDTNRRNFPLNQSLNQSINM